VQQTWPIGGDGWWDYLTTDPDAHLLYIGRANRVQVVDTQTGKLVHEILGQQGVHGVALDPNGKLGYISDGAANMVRVFDRATFQVTASIPSGGKNPDAILFEPTTRRVFAFNGRSRSFTVIDTAKNAVLKTVLLPGKPEFAQTDNAGQVYVNIEDRNFIARIDAASMAVTAIWPIAPCDSPTGLAMDREGHRLFSVCEGNWMVVTNTDNGHIVATVPIGGSPDGVRYDPQRHLIFSSNGEGTLSIIEQKSPNKYVPLQTLDTQPGARTLALDRKTGKVYLVTASFGPPPEPTQQNPSPRPALLPGSFVVLVVGSPAPAAEAQHNNKK
jgi:DNA-binding beta-propeller fold protein YncE